MNSEMVISSLDWRRFTTRGISFLSALESEKFFLMVEALNGLSAVFFRVADLSRRIVVTPKIRFLKFERLIVKTRKFNVFFFCRIIELRNGRAIQGAVHCSTQQTSIDRDLARFTRFTQVRSSGKRVSIAIVVGILTRERFFGFE